MQHATGICDRIKTPKWRPVVYKENEGGRDTLDFDYNYSTREFLVIRFSNLSFAHKFAHK